MSLGKWPPLGRDRYRCPSLRLTPLGCGVGGLPNRAVLLIKEIYVTSELSFSQAKSEAEMNIKAGALASNTV